MDIKFEMKNKHFFCFNKQTNFSLDKINKNFEIK